MAGAGDSPSPRLHRQGTSCHNLRGLSFLRHQQKDSGFGNCCQAPLMPLLEASLFPGGGASPPICQPLPHPKPLSDLFAVKSQFCPLVKSHKSPLPGSCRHSSRALRRGGTQKLQGETPAGGAEGAPSELRGSWTLPRRRVTRGRQGTATRQTPVDAHSCFPLAHVPSTDT